VRYLFCGVAIMISLITLSGCEAKPPDVAFSDIDMSAADAGSGDKLFHQSNNGAPTCASCHGDDGGSGIGPTLAGISEKAGSRPDGESAEEYLYWSIVSPSKDLTTGYSNVMYAKYGEIFGAEDLADIIAYLLTLE